ncbi:hypothetical protein P5673_008327 [Acropora cervicornis]|uniref:Uncharacterized protein n=1 Tax=Acropora cervicornis TaxID=6130 RepID=A0AAD9QTY0_ACRCE|nr:hypothetical protein P5673_008327 [Acropora cervicornis]
MFSSEEGKLGSAPPVNVFCPCNKNENFFVRNSEYRKLEMKKCRNSTVNFEETKSGQLSLKPRLRPLFYVSPSARKLDYKINIRIFSKANLVLFCSFVFENPIDLWFVSPQSSDSRPYGPRSSVDESKIFTAFLACARPK